MQMYERRIGRWAAVLAVLLLVVCACERNSSEPTDQQTETSTEESTEDDQNLYSSFGVKLEGGEKFRLISFKDVGLGRSNPTPTDAILETIAQSLAYEMQLEEDLQLSPRVVHNDKLADPAEHTYCEKHRLYVDVWRSESPSRWGYSLWSGCSENHRFEWQEIPVESTHAEELDEAVEPLTKGIVESLANARETGCFTRTC